MGPTRTIKNNSVFPDLGLSLTKIKKENKNFSPDDVIVWLLFFFFLKRTGLVAQGTLATE
jgi:hypothetical protein